MGESSSHRAHRAETEQRREDPSTFPSSPDFPWGAVAGGGGGLRPPRPVLPESPLHTPSNTTTHNTSQPVSEELSPPEQVT